MTDNELALAELDEVVKQNEALRQISERHRGERISELDEKVTELDGRVVNYSLTKEGDQISLNGSDGSKTTVTDSSDPGYIPNERIDQICSQVFYLV